jgi:Tfp pilus assembly protein PilV
MSEKGQSLIEVMVALGVAVIIITAIVVAVVLAVINTQFAKTQNLATYYAKQGLEIVRQISNSDWNTFENFSGWYCLKKGITVPIARGTDCSDSASNLRREVYFISPLDEARRDENQCEIGTTGLFGGSVSVIVSWNDNKCKNQNDFCHHVQLDSCFQNLNAVPTP